MVYPLKNKQLIGKLFNKRTIIHAKTLSIGYLKVGRTFEYDYLPGFLILVFKNSFKKAVVRNKIRRQIRMMLRDYKFSQKNYLIVISVKTHYLNTSYNENMKLLHQLLKKMEGGSQCDLRKKKMKTTTQI